MITSTEKRAAVSALRRQLAKGFDSDAWACRIEYRDSKGLVTSRVISPIRFVGRDSVLALCLCRQEPRQFLFAGIRKIEMIPANDVQMPEPITEVKPTQNQ